MQLQLNHLLGVAQSVFMGCMTGVQFPRVAWIGSGVHPPSCPLGTGGSFPRSKEAGV